MAIQKVQWGVLGAASIAVRKVIPGMQAGEWSEVAAIASRDRAIGLRTCQFWTRCSSMEATGGMLRRPNHSNAHGGRREVRRVETTRDQRKL